MMEPPGTLFVTSAALLWLPSGDDTQPDSDIDVGLRIAFENVEPEAIDVAQRGWDDHVVTTKCAQRLARDYTDILGKVTAPQSLKIST